MFLLSAQIILRSLSESCEPWFVLCSKTAKLYFYLLRNYNVSLTVVIGLNSRTIVVIARRVWVCP